MAETPDEALEKLLRDGMPMGIDSDTGAATEDMDVASEIGAGPRRNEPVQMSSSPVWDVVVAEDDPVVQRRARNAAGGASVAWGKYENTFREVGTRYGVDPYLLATMAGLESGGDPNAVGTTDDAGLMQFISPTWNEVMPGYDLDDRFDPELSIEAAGKYLRRLSLSADGDLDVAVQSYNAGLGNVMRAIRNEQPLNRSRYYLPTVVTARALFEQGLADESSTPGMLNNAIDRAGE